MLPWIWHLRVERKSLWSLRWHVQACSARCRYLFQVQLEGLQRYGGSYGTEYRKQVDEGMRKGNVIG